MGFDFEIIERVDSINKNRFLNEYYKPQKPVIVTNQTKDWNAVNAWDFNYLNKIAGDLVVPLYNNDPVDYSKKVNEPVAKMTFSEYIEILQNGPTELRIFLFNLLKHVPQLQKDFQYPDLGIKLMKSLPMLFVGGEGSNVFMHYDIDLANLLHFHFIGKKRCVLIPPSQTKFMYKIPYSTICREDINFDEPDFEKWQGLKHIKPMVADISHGDMLYIPEGYWHYMKYLTPGLSLTLRSIAKKPKNFLAAVNNVFFIRNIDNIMRKIQGQKWIDYKNQKAITNTEKVL